MLRQFFQHSHNECLNTPKKTVFLLYQCGRQETVYLFICTEMTGMAAPIVAAVVLLYRACKTSSSYLRSSKWVALVEEYGSKSPAAYSTGPPEIQVYRVLALLVFHTAVFLGMDQL